MTKAKFSGKVDFGDWWPHVRDAQDMIDELQATFETNDENYIYFTDDGLSVCLDLASLGHGYGPAFTASLADMAEWFVRFSDDDDEDRAKLKLLSDELRRVAGIIDAALEQNKSET